MPALGLLRQLATRHLSGGLLGNESRAIGWSASLVALGLASAATSLLHPVLDGQSFMVFLVAVAVSAALGGIGPGLLATVCSIAVIDFFFLTPTLSFIVLATTDLWLLGIFTAVAGLLSVVGAALRSARLRAVEERERALGMSRFFERQLRLSEALRDSETILAVPIGRAAAERGGEHR